MTPTKGPWKIHPEYNQSNVYRLWDKNGNYPRDCSMARMDANATLMTNAPRYLKALQSIAGNTCCAGCQEAKLIAQQALEDRP